MVVRLKQSTPFVVQAIPQPSQAKVTFNGQWLALRIIDIIDNLIEIGLCVRGIVTDNHSANVNPFSVLEIIPFKIKLLHKAPRKE